MHVQLKMTLPLGLSEKVGLTGSREGMDNYLRIWPSGSAYNPTCYMVYQVSLFNHWRATAVRVQPSR